MRCTHCEYLLFNLTQPVCPECGGPFDVEAYQFELAAVAFHCPHCDQEYYGNDEMGLPYPRRFPCIQCNNDLTLQEMRVEPKKPDAMGRLREAGHSPWERRREIGIVKAWWSTFAMTLASPGKFFRIHSDRSLYEAWLFATITLYVGMIPYALFATGVFWLIGALGPGGGLPPTAFLAFMYFIPTLVAPPVLPFLAGCIWACTIRIALRLMGAQRLPFRSTLVTTLFSFGPTALLAVPLCGGYVGAVWQYVTLIIGIREVHHVSGWRAAISVLWPVVLLFGLYLGFIVLLILGFFDVLD